MPSSSSVPPEMSSSVLQDAPCGRPTSIRRPRRRDDDPLEPHLYTSGVSNHVVKGEKPPRQRVRFLRRIAFVVSAHNGAHVGQVVAVVARSKAYSRAAGEFSRSAQTAAAKPRC